MTFNGHDLRKRVIVSGMREKRCFEGGTSVISHGNIRRTKRQASTSRHRAFTSSIIYLAMGKVVYPTQCSRAEANDIVSRLRSYQFSSHHTSRSRASRFSVRTIYSSGEPVWLICTEFNMQIGRLHDMIVGVSSRFNNGTCIAKMGRARQK